MQSKLRFNSDAELTELIEGFEKGTLPPEQWTHSAHVIVASYYLTQMHPDLALAILRERIRRYNEMTGGRNSETRGYHETLTVFWVRILTAALAGVDAPRHQQINRMVDLFGDCSGLWREYYSFNVVMSREARARWVEPDIRPLQ